MHWVKFGILWRAMNARKYFFPISTFKIWRGDSNATKRLTGREIRYIAIYIEQFLTT